MEKYIFRNHFLESFVTEASCGIAIRCEITGEQISRIYETKIEKYDMYAVYSSSLGSFLTKLQGDIIYCVLCKKTLFTMSEGRVILELLNSTYVNLTDLLNFLNNKEKHIGEVAAIYSVAGINCAVKYIKENKVC